MTRSIHTSLGGSLAWLTLAMFLSASPAFANEIWVTPTYQQDTGGFGVGSSKFWPVTARGVVRLAWAVPADLLTFREARVVLIPHAPAGTSVLSVVVCSAANAESALTGCAGAFDHAFTGVSNQLLEVDISADIAPRIGTPGANYIAVLLQTTTTQATDHILGLRFSYEPALPAILATEGFQNTFVGVDAGGLDVSFADSNTAVGNRALDDLTTGDENTAVGSSALADLTAGKGNTAVGTLALQSSFFGDDNTALGTRALGLLAVGQRNIAIGAMAGGLLVSGNENIYLGSTGPPLFPLTDSESRTIRIGQGHSRAFLSGVRGTTTGQSNAVNVVIDSFGQLGTVSSSRRYKDDIRDMSDASRALLALRPVTFRYSRPFADGARPIQYGLIAEEVAEVLPDLVVRDDEGRPDTVQYQKLEPMMLNELQRLHRQVQDLAAEVGALRRRLSRSGR